MDCNCAAAGNPDLEHFRTCPVYEPPLSYEELRQVRALFTVLSAWVDELVDGIRG